MPDAGLGKADRAEIEHDRPADKEARRVPDPPVELDEPIDDGAGASTKAMNERPQKRIELFASLALVTAAPAIFCEPIVRALRRAMVNAELKRNYSQR